MALFPSVIPWTLVFDTSNDSWFSSDAWGEGGAHLIRKCLQVEVICGLERQRGENDPEIWINASYWVQLSTDEGEKLLFTLWLGKARRPQNSSRCTPQQKHVHIQCQDLRGTVQQVVLNSELSKLTDSVELSAPQKKLYTGFLYSGENT